MDISATTAPRSDQQNFDDYISGSKVWTIADVKAGSAEQPVELHLQEAPGRPYKPSKSMRRVLVACWGAEASAYVGRRIELYGDPNVKWAGQPVGGIRISSLSHLEKPVKLNLTEKRGQRAPVTIHPLPDVQPVDIQPHLDAIQQASTLDQLKAAWETATAASKDPRILTATNKRKAELTQPETTA